MCKFASVLAILLPMIGFPLNAQGDLQRGKQFFDALCARCHGLDGTGGEGPNLNRPTLPRAQDDTALIAIIRDGIPAGGMPPVLKYGSDNELRQLVLYVRSLGQTAEVPVPGSAKGGATVYARLGCSGCHAIGGEGGGFGPELSNIGLHRSAAYLREAITEPEKTLPRGVLPVPGRGLTEFLPVRIVTRDGHEISGIRINEDTFTIQVKDMSNQFHSFLKADLKQLEKQPTRSLMPAFGKLSASELDDLVAYLSSPRDTK